MQKHLSLECGYDYELQSWKERRTIPTVNYATVTYTATYSTVLVVELNGATSCCICDSNLKHLAVQQPIYQHKHALPRQIACIYTDTHQNRQDKANRQHKVKTNREVRVRES